MCDQFYHGQLIQKGVFARFLFFVNTTDRYAVKTKHTANRITITTENSATHDFIHQWSNFIPPPPLLFFLCLLKSCVRVLWWLKYYTTPQGQQTRCKLQRVENQIQKKKIYGLVLLFSITTLPL